MFLKLKKNLKNLKFEKINIVNKKRLLKILTAFIFLFLAPFQSISQSLFVKNNFPIYNTILQPSFQQFDFYNGKNYNFNILFQYSNSFVNSDIDSNNLEDSIIFDMETAYNLFKGEKRLNAYSSIYMEIPFTYNWKGAFDSTIENYHSLLGFSNGGRENYPKNTFRYKFGELDLTNPSGGLGDITVGYSIFKIKDISSFRFAFSMFFKIPTGSVTKGLSSGSFDYGVKTSFSNIFKYFQIDYGFGWILYGSPDKTYSTQLTNSGFGYIAFSSKITENIKGVMQLYLASSPFNTGYNRVDDYQAMLSIGLNWKDWQISFSEDVFTYTAPDIMVSVNKKFRF